MSESFYEQLFSVRGKVALVTGGTRGIGLLIAEALLRAGARVYISSRKVDACHEAEASLSKHGDCTAFPCDISTLDGCKQLAGEIAKREEKLDILVNNAGLTWTADLDEFPEKGFLPAPAALAAAPGGGQPRAARIGHQHLVGERARARRPAQLLLRRCQIRSRNAQSAAGQRLDGRSHQRECDCPRPLPLQDDGTPFTSEESEKAVIASVPMKRDGKMEDIGGLTIFLSSKAGSYLTGATIACDGGATMAT